VRPSDAEIVRHHDSPHPDSAALVAGQRQEPYEIRLLEHDPAWADEARRVAAHVRALLGDRALEVHHVGSTSVTGLPAKPILDLDLVVADAADEPAYVPDLVAGGFVHRIREPWWHEHRLLVWHGSTPRTTLHVFGPDCPEVVRLLMFLDRLREHEDVRERYAAAKREAAAATNAAGGTGMDYNRVKEPVVRALYDEMFRERGLLR
jgi:GrpB-like predicted nucleotidyltransferase (UPF0157 family)